MEDNEEWDTATEIGEQPLVPEAGGEWQIVPASRSRRQNTRAAPSQQGFRSSTVTAVFRAGNTHSSPSPHSRPQKDAQSTSTVGSSNNQFSARRRDVVDAHRSRESRTHHGAIGRYDSRTVDPNRPAATTAPSAIPLSPGNPGETALREGRPPLDDVRIPWELLRTRNDFFKPGVQETGAYAQALQRNGRVFGLWGERDAVNQTKMTISAKITASQRSARLKRMPRVESSNDAQRTRYERAYGREVAKYTFNIRPPHDMAFAAIGVFHWPVKDIDPREAFGQLLDRLDHIRLRTRCYILVNKGQDAIEIMSESSTTDVQHAMAKVQTAYFQQKARQQPTLRKHLVCWTNEDNSVPTHVALHPHTSPKVIPELRIADGPISGQQMTSLLAVGPRTHRLESGHQQLSFARETARVLIMNKINSVRYRQGPLKLRLHLGVFVPTRYKKPTSAQRFDMQEFVDMVDGQDFRGMVTQELGDPVIEDGFLPLLHSTTGSFEPRDPIHDTLHQVTPSYSAIFDFTDTPMGRIRLEVTWAGEGDFRQISKQSWSLLDDDPRCTKVLLDIKLINLSTTRAWHIDMSGPSAILESRIPEKLKAFVQTISLVQNGPDVCSVTYGNCKSLAATQTRATYSYLFTRSDVTLDVTRFQATKFQPLRKYEQRWGISVYRNDWDFMFTENENMPIGKAARWAEDQETWFPADSSLDAPEAGNGWEQLIEKLTVIEELVQATSNP